MNTKNETQNEYILELLKTGECDSFGESEIAVGPQRVRELKSYLGKNKIPYSTIFENLQE